MLGDTSSKVDWQYVRRLFGCALVVLGAFLLGEHIYHWGFELYDIIGHEWLGLLLIVLGILLTLRTNKTSTPDESAP
jgi:uncharacterized membrane protein YfcA